MDAIVEFLKAAAGERAIEWLAVALGLANVGLLIRRNILNYPFGLAMVAIYAVIFTREKLYSDALLQLFFFVVQIYGWLHWRRSRDTDGLVIVGRLTPLAGLAYAIAAASGTYALGAFMSRHTDAAFPYWDASIAALSVVAQIMMARRRLEHWFVWILVDVLAIALYWTKGLQPTATLYAIFLIMSVAGFFSWRGSFRAQRP